MNFDGPAYDALADVVAVQADGKVLVLGDTLNEDGKDIALVRYNSDGSYDSSFGVGGRVVSDLGHSNDRAWCLTIGPEGNIYAGATAGDGNPVIVRYSMNGTKEAQFVTRGGEAIVFQPDGKFIVRGGKNYQPILPRRQLGHVVW